MYKSPITIIESTIDSFTQSIIKQKDDAIFAEIQHSFGVDMDKEELIRALKYDRDQYEKGYADGKADATQKWIPVTERLPEDDKNIRFYDDGRLRCTTVLAYTEYGRTIPKNRLLVRATGNEWLDTQVTDGWEWSSGTEKVTHWMPHPEPPKGE